MIAIRNALKNKKGFTLIELVIVMVILGILAVVAVPRFIDLTDSAKAASTQAALGAVRATLAVKYAEAAAAGSAAYPASLTAADFANNQLPTNKLNGASGIGVVATDAIPSGTATSNTNGFWYVQTGANAGQAGAYSDGTVNTSTW